MSNLKSFHVCFVLFLKFFLSSSQSILCDIRQPNHHCIIVCDETDECVSNTIYCNTNNNLACSIFCNNTRSCNDMTIYAYYTNDFRLLCENKKACSKMSFVYYY